MVGMVGVGSNSHEQLARAAGLDGAHHSPGAVSGAVARPDGLRLASECPETSGA